MVKALAALFTALPSVLRIIEKIVDKIEAENKRREQDKLDKVTIKEAVDKIDLAFDTDDEVLLNEISNS